MRKNRKKKPKNLMKTRTFDCEAMSHDLFSTKFCRDGKVDPLANSDYKEPPIVAYRVPNENKKTEENKDD